MELPAAAESAFLREMKQLVESMAVWRKRGSAVAIMGVPSGQWALPVAQGGNVGGQWSKGLPACCITQTSRKDMC